MEQQQQQQQQKQQQYAKPLFSPTSSSQTTALASALSKSQSRSRSRSHSDSITIDITAAIPTKNPNILDTTVTDNDTIYPLNSLSSSCSKASSLTNSSSSSSTPTFNIPTPTTTTRTSARPRLGYFFMFLSAICHALVAFFMHLATSIDHLSPITALFIRSITSLVLSLIYFAIPFTPSLTTVFQPLLIHSHPYLPTPTDEAHEEEQERSSRRRLTMLLVMRGLVGSVTSGTAFAALAYLPVGTAVTLFYLSPALTALIAHVHLGEPLTRRLIGVIILNFIGIALVSNNSSSSSSDKPRSIAAGVPSMNNTGQGVIFAVVSACGASLVYTTQRAMGFRLHFVLGVLSFGIACLLLVMLIILSLLILRQFSSSLPPDSLWSFSLSRDLASHARGVGMAIVSGLAGFGSQSFLNLGLAHTPPAPAVVVRSLNVPMSYAAGFIALGERPNAAGTVGVACVVASVVAIAVEKMSVAAAAATGTGGGGGGGTREDSSGTTIAAAAAAKKREDGQDIQRRGESHGSG